MGGILWGASTWCTEHFLLCHPACGSLPEPTERPLAAAAACAQTLSSLCQRLWLPLGPLLNLGTSSTGLPENNWRCLYTCLSCLTTRFLSHYRYSSRSAFLRLFKLVTRIKYKALVASGTCRAVALIIYWRKRILHCEGCHHGSKPVFLCFFLF